MFDYYFCIFVCSSLSGACLMDISEPAGFLCKNLANDSHFKKLSFAADYISQSNQYDKIHFIYVQNRQNLSV